MKLRFLFATLAAASLLAACGGDAPPQTAATPHLLAATATSPAAFSFPGLRADYDITETVGGYLVKELAGNGATAVPHNTRLRFADVSVGFDLEGVSGQAFRLYRAVFDRMPDVAGIGYWIGQMDRGVDPALVAGAIMESAEFKARYGTGLSDVDFVAKLYLNVLHRDGDPAGQAFWTGLLQRGAATRAQVLAAFSNGAEAKAAVSDAIRTGIYFIEEGVAYVPAADPGPVRAADLGSRVTLDGGASTVAAGKPIAYYWSLGKKPAGSNAVLTDALSVHPSFVPDVEGEYEVKLVVSDGIDFSREVKTTVAGIWVPDVAQMPASGNLVHLVSDAGGPLGTTNQYTQANAVLSVTADKARLNVSVQGDEHWNGYLALPTTLGKLVPGYYGGLGTDSWSDKGGVSWTSSYFCTTASNWLVIDSVTYDGDTLTAVDLRFFQKCTYSNGAIHGRVRWSKGDTTQPPGPVTPIPAGLWEPAPDATPASDSYVYLESAPGENMGGGKRYTFTAASGKLSVNVNGAHVSVRITGDSYDSNWTGELVGMNSVTRLVPGYYGNLKDYPATNPTRGGLEWTRYYYSCTASGWFVVDNVTYAGNVLQELDLRFEQYCNGYSAPLNGKIHWRAPGH
jgi:hypothetical protein